MTTQDHPFAADLLDEIGARVGMNEEEAHQLDDAERMLAAIRAVLALHVPDEDGDCSECDYCTPKSNLFPCDTVRAITAALTPAEVPE